MLFLGTTWLPAGLSVDSLTALIPVHPDARSLKRQSHCVSSQLRILSGPPPCPKLQVPQCSVPTWSLITAWFLPFSPASTLLPHHLVIRGPRKAKQFAETPSLLPPQREHTSGSLYEWFPLPGGSYPSTSPNQPLFILQNPAQRPFPPGSQGWKRCFTLAFLEHQCSPQIRVHALLQFLVFPVSPIYLWVPGPLHTENA